jgi:hypothetical protein
LDISGKGIRGKLELRGFSNLENLVLSKNMITELDISDCAKIRNLECCSTNLEKTDFLTKLPNPRKLIRLNIRSNNFLQRDLSVFSHFSNLKTLLIGNNNEAKIKRGVYNKFWGSLDHLVNLDKLEELCIANTDIDKVCVTNLPNSIRKINCSSEERPEAKVKKITKKLNDYFTKK